MYMGHIHADRVEEAWRDLAKAAWCAGNNRK